MVNDESPTVNFQRLDKGVDAVKLGRYIDGLRAVWRALVTADAMVGLAQTWHTAVISHKESPPGPGIILRLPVLGYVSLIDTFIIM